MHPSLSIIGEEEGDLRGRCLVLGVTASAALYRAVDLARKLMRLGARVRVVMTPRAAELVSPQLFEWATGEQAVDRLTGEIEHVALARDCDAVVVAPATLDTMAEIALFRASTPVSALAQEAAGLGKPVLIVPAMHLGMWRRASGLVDELRRQGFHVMEPVRGAEQAKMPPVELVAWWVEALVSRGDDLRGVDVLVTAGPTREPLDAVRVVTNRSTGKMGVYLALEAAWRGANVTLVHGPLCVPLPRSWEAYLEESVYAETAAEMAAALEKHSPGKQLGIYAAAVTDYAPASPLDRKLDTRRERRETIELVATPKAISAAVSANPAGVHIGFSADAASSIDELLEKARQKLEHYRLDAVVANNIAEEGAGFGADTNHVYIVSWRGWTSEIPKMHKRLVARRVLDAARRLLVEGPRPR